MLLPVDFISNINPGKVIVNADILHDHGFQILSLNPDRGAYRPFLHPTEIGNVVHFPGFFLIIVVDIPGIEIMRSVLITHDHIACLAFQEKLPVRAQIFDRSKLSLFVEVNFKETVLHEGGAHLHLLLCLLPLPY